MEDKEKSKAQLINELAELHQRIAELEAAATEHKQTEERLQVSPREQSHLVEGQPAEHDITEWVQAEEKFQRRTRELTLLNRVIAASAASMELEHIMEKTCRELALAFEVPQATAFLLNEEKTEATLVAEFLTDDRPSVLNEVVSVVDNPVAQYLLTHKAPLVVKDAQSDPRLALIRDLLRRRGTVSFLIIPLIIEEEGVGAFSLGAIQPRDFSTAEVDLAWSVAKQVSGALRRIRLEEAHQRLEEQYYQAQKMDAIGRLLGGVAHDFSNLLMAINGFAELMQYRLELDDSNRQMVNHILNSGQRATDLIRQLLAFCRKQAIEPKVLNLNVLVADLDKMLRRIIGEDIQIETFLTPDLWPVKADPSQLEQIIVNLAVNARDAMPDGGYLTLETANVTLGQEYLAHHLDVPPGEYVQLAVSDSGIGMTGEVKARIFEPFFTTKAEGKGTGLGLATVFGVVKQSSGYIWVHSEPGHGTTFEIYLPRIQAVAAPSARSEQFRNLPTGHETVLVVEDAPGVREMTIAVLRQLGYTVLEAGDGPAAIHLAQQYQEPINLLLTDVVLPSLNGKVLATQLAQLHPGLKQLFMSGYTDEAIVHHGFLEPGTAFLQKPFTTAKLARKVREVLDGK
jgi:signal transduction histidine kinase